MSLRLGNTNIAGPQILYSTTGSGTDGAMTQATTTIELDNCVHKTGDETITGNKTISIDNLDLSQNIYFNSWQTFLSQYSAASNPTNVIELYKNPIRDNNGRYIAWNTCVIRPNGTIVNGLYARSTDGNTDVTGELSVLVNKDGNMYATAPASATNGAIVTTVNKTKADRGYFQLGNGMIIQWGLDTMAANVTTASITYPKAFTSGSSYAVLTCHRGSSVTSSMSRPDNNTSTGFTCTYNSSYTNARHFYWIAVGY